MLKKWQTIPYLIILRYFSSIFFLLILFQGLSERQFVNMYKRAFPNAINPSKLANSVFRLCDRDNDGVIDFAEFVASLCIPPTR